MAATEIKITLSDIEVKYLREAVEAYTDARLESLELRARTFREKAKSGNKESRLKIAEFLNTKSFMIQDIAAVLLCKLQ